MSDWLRCDPQRLRRTISMRLTAISAAACALTLGTAYADDGLGLKRSGNRSDVSISGLSSGAAMAVQYAVAHSGSIVGVGTIAGPAWGCADGSLSRAVNHCMCGRDALQSNINNARQLAANGEIDSLSSGRPRALKRSYVFHSPADDTVREQSGKAKITFLAGFIGSSPTVSWGDPSDGSDKASHGIISPDSGNEPCRFSGSETTFVRQCGSEDNAGRMFHALYGGDSVFDASKRVNDIPEAEVWRFDQQRLIEQVKATVVTVADDRVTLWWPWWPYSSARRKNLDMAKQGYIYVPPSCRQTGSSCRVHIALHGCRQSARTFATRAGYNNWAEHYKTIVVYPATEPSTPASEAVCQAPPVNPSMDSWYLEPNPNGCWDWWGYLDPSSRKDRYLTKDGPQIRLIERIITEVTASP